MMQAVRTTTPVTDTAPAPLQVTKRMLQGLAPLPDTALKLLALLNDADVSLREVATLATRDLGISASFLRMANSPMFGRRGSVGTVMDAIRIIGITHARLLVLASGVSQIAQRELPLYGLAAGAFMKHSELVANLTMMVSREGGYPNIGLAYSAGLLHDIGKVILNGQVQQQGMKTPPSLEAKMSVPGCTLLLAEQEIFGINHAQIGQQLGDLWSLPSELLEAIALHHEAPNEGEQLLATCVAIANGIAGLIDSEYPSLNRAALQPLPRWVDMDRLDAMAKECLGDSSRPA